MHSYQKTTVTPAAPTNMQLLRAFYKGKLGHCGRLETLAIKQMFELLQWGPAQGPGKK